MLVCPLAGVCKTCVNNTIMNGFGPIVNSLDIPGHDGYSDRVGFFFYFFLLLKGMLIVCFFA